MSIQLRLLLAIVLVLPVFLGLTGYFLDQAFYNYQLQGQQQSMSLRQLLLAKAADWDGQQWQAEELDDPRFELSDSGLYALITDDAGQIAWHSNSADNFSAQQKQAITAFSQSQQVPSSLGGQHFSDCHLDAGYFCYVQRVAWGSSGPQALFIIVEEQSDVRTARNAYRQQLVALSVATMVGLLFTQTLIFYWGLAPLRRVAAKLAKLERGEIDSIDGNYPLELRPLTDNIGLLLDSEKRRRDRVRTTMDRLAHVLKSPLMLLRNAPAETDYRELVDEQVERMLGIIEGELARARLDGRPVNIMGKPIDAAPVLHRITQAYSKLPRPAAAADQAVSIDTSGIQEGTLFIGEERDLQDLYGSLLENALKYTRSWVAITAQQFTENQERVFSLTIADDGNGIPEGMESDILKRGARADTVRAGHGLGLSIVIEILSAYGGSLEVTTSTRGGALFQANIPMGRSKRGKA